MDSSLPKGFELESQPLPEGFEPETPMPAGFEPEDQAFGSGSQQAIAGLEGAAQGIAGPLATLAETKLLGVKSEDIASRERVNPWTHRAGEAAGLIGGYMSGAGELGLIARGAEGVNAALKLGKIGGMVLKGGLEAAALAGSEEASHYLTGYSPEQTVSSALATMGYAGIMGAATGGIFGLGDITANTGIKLLEDKKLISRAEEWLAKQGAYVQENPHIVSDFIAKKISHGVSDTVGTGVGGTIGGHVGGPAGAAIGAQLGYKATQKLIDPIIDKVLKKRLTTMSQKYVVPQVVKALTSESVQSLPSAVMYGMKAAKGAKLLDKAMTSIFVPGEAWVAGSIDQQARERVKQNIEDNGLDEQMKNSHVEPGTQSFAEGGRVKGIEDSSFGSTFPAENTMMQSAKARVYNHLKQLKPRQKLNAPYDNKDPMKAQEKIYDQALDLATNPLHIIDHIKKGSISSSHIMHMNQMWPELAEYMRKGLTTKITESQMKGEKPSYKLRQSLSMFLGTPLQSVMQPSSILAAQAAFQPSGQQPSPNQSPTKEKRGTSTLGKSNNQYRTQTESAEADRVTRK